MKTQCLVQTAFVMRVLADRVSWLTAATYQSDKSTRSVMVYKKTIFLLVDSVLQKIVLMYVWFNIFSLYCDKGYFKI